MKIFEDWIYRDFHRISEIFRFLAKISSISPVSFTIFPYGIFFIGLRVSYYTKLAARIIVGRILYDLKAEANKRRNFSQASVVPPPFPDVALRGVRGKGEFKRGGIWPPNTPDSIYCTV